MSTQRHDAAAPAGGAGSAKPAAGPSEPEPASAEVEAVASSGAPSRRAAVASGAGAAEAPPASERAPDSTIALSERDWLPVSSASPRSIVPSTQRSAVDRQGGPVSEQAPTSTLEIDERDWLAVSPPLPGAEARPPRPAPPAAPPAPPATLPPPARRPSVPQPFDVSPARKPSLSRPLVDGAPARRPSVSQPFDTAPARKPSVSRPLVDGAPARKPSVSRPFADAAPAGDLLHPGTDEMADSGIFSPASRRAPDPWASPSIVPPPPAGPPVEARPHASATEAESSSTDGAGAVVKAPPRVESRPLPRWAFAAAPLALLIAFGVGRILFEPVPVATSAIPITPGPGEVGSPPAAVEPKPGPVEAPPPAASEAPNSPATAEPSPSSAAPADSSALAHPTSEQPSAPEPRRPAPNTLRPGEEPAPKPRVTPPPAPAGESFNRDAASLSIGGALAKAQSCVSGGMSGVARVSVTFAPSGRATQATVEGPPFAGTPAGGCIAMRARAASVPPFPGGPVTVHKSVRF